MIGSVSAEKLILEEIHRFPNGPIEEDGALNWDFGKLMGEIKAGIAKAARPGPPAHKSGGSASIAGGSISGC